MESTASPVMCGAMECYYLRSGHLEENPSQSAMLKK